MSDLKLVIGNKNYSSWSLRPWFWLKYHDIDFCEKRISLFSDDMEANLAPYYSDSKVPVLVADGVNIWDSLAILETLSERFPQFNGYPVDRNARAVARSMVAEMHSGFFGIRSECAMNVRRSYSNFKLSDDAHNDVKRIESLWQFSRSKYSTGGDWLFGEFSIVDAMYSPVVFRLKNYDISVSEETRDYMQMVLAHPVIKEWIASSYAETEVIERSEYD